MSFAGFACILLSPIYCLWQWRLSEGKLSQKALRRMIILPAFPIFMFLYGTHDLFWYSERMAKKYLDGMTDLELTNFEQIY